MSSLYKIINIELFPSEFLGYTDPEDYYNYNGILLQTGEKRLYHNLDELLSHVAQRREAQGMAKIDEDRLSHIIQQYLYELEEAPRSLFRKFKPQGRTFLSDVKKGVRMALSLSKAAYSGVSTSFDGGWVSKKIAKDRAKVCYNCPENITDLDKKLLQRLGDEIALSFKRSDRVTSYDDHLGACGVCGCPNELKVHLSEEVIIEVNEEGDNVAHSSEFPEGPFEGIHDKELHECWVRKILKTHEDK